MAWNYVEHVGWHELKRSCIGIIGISGEIAVGAISAGPLRTCMLSKKQIAAQMAVAQN